MKVALEGRDLHVRYRRRSPFLARLGRDRDPWINVVRGVSLAIEAGRTLAVVGESGSGKTTLAMALMGLVPMAAGTVSIAGAPLAQGPRGHLRPDRARVAMLFQDPIGSLSPRMTVGRALAEPFEIHRRSNGKTQDQIDGSTLSGRHAASLRLLDLVGLGREFADRYPHQLSGGQARRVSVARALALEPALLIADEPTAGLDVSIQGDVLNLLTSLQERLGLAILIITHNLNIVRHVADSTAIMYLGRFVEQGPTEAIYAHSRHPYTRALLSANPSPDPTVKAQRLDLAGEVPSPLHRPAGCEFHPRCPLVEERCRLEAPDQREEAPDHRFRCHFPIEDRDPRLRPDTTL